MEDHPRHMEGLRVGRALMAPKGDGPLPLPAAAAAAAAQQQEQWQRHSSCCRTRWSLVAGLTAAAAAAAFSCLKRCSCKQTIHPAAAMLAAFPAGPAQSTAASSTVSGHAADLTDRILQTALGNPAGCWVGGCAASLIYCPGCSTTAGLSHQHQHSSRPCCGATPGTAHVH